LLEVSTLAFKVKKILALLILTGRMAKASSQLSQTIIQKTGKDNPFPVSFTSTN
jgi:hypothetical protein